MRPNQPGLWPQPPGTRSTPNLREPAPSPRAAVQPGKFPGPGQWSGHILCRGHSYLPGLWGARCALLVLELNKSLSRDRLLISEPRGVAAGYLQFPLPMTERPLIPPRKHKQADACGMCSRCPSQLLYPLPSNPSGPSVGFALLPAVIRTAPKLTSFGTARMRLAVQCLRLGRRMNPGTSG